MAQPGWGNQKGHIYARQKKADETCWARVTRESAPHSSEVRQVILPQDILGGHIQFGYYVGGGGGHKLYITSAELEVCPSKAGSSGHGIHYLVQF